MHELFANLASMPRLSILCYLNDQDGRNSDISEKIGMSLQALHRHIKSLQAGGLIQKDSTGRLSITNFGYAILTQMPTFQFLWKHKKYFEEHSLVNLPSESIQTIGSLNNCEMLDGTAAIIEKWKVMTSNANEYLKVVTGQVILDLASHTAEKIKKGLRMSYVLGQNTVVPKGRTDMLNKIGWRKLISEGLVERKMAESVHINLVITEKEAAINFPRLDGTLDVYSNFYSSDQQFHNWASKLFEHIWNHAGVFSDTKLVER